MAGKHFPNPKLYPVRCPRCERLIARIPARIDSLRLSGFTKRKFPAANGELIEKSGTSESQFPADSLHSGGLAGKECKRCGGGGTLFGCMERLNEGQGISKIERIKAMNNFSYRVEFETKSVSLFNQAMDGDGHEIESLSGQYVISKKEIPMLVENLQKCLAVLEEGKLFLNDEAFSLEIDEQI